MKMERNVDGDEGGDGGACPDGESPPTHGRDALDEILEFAARLPPPERPPDGEDSPPQLDLGESLRDKFSELEEISRRLKSRLESVVLDGEIALSPDAELDPDFDSVSRAEDLTPQEFSLLLDSATRPPPRPPAPE